jgi:hypothetical protein
MNWFLRKNANHNKILFLIFFSVALVTETIHRYHYRAELNFKLSEFEIELMLLIGLILLNPKGIKIILLAVFILLIGLSTRNLILFHEASKSLLLKDAISFSQLDALWIYSIHQIIYLYFAYRVIRN